MYEEYDSVRFLDFFFLSSRVILCDYPLPSPSVWVHGVNPTPLGTPIRRSP